MVGAIMPGPHWRSLNFGAYIAAQIIELDFEGCFIGREGKEKAWNRSQEGKGHKRGRDW